MKEQATVCVAYTGEAVNDGTMDVAKLAPAQDEELQELVSSQQLMLRIVNISFERGLKWRFDDGNEKFYAYVKDENFLSAIEAGRLSFGCGDGIVAEVETKQQHVKGELRKATKSITKVLKINKRGDGNANR